MKTERIFYIIIYFTESRSFSVELTEFISTEEANSFLHGLTDEIDYALDNNCLVEIDRKWVNPNNIAYLELTQKEE